MTTNTQTQHCELSVTLTIEGRFLTAASAPFLPGIDTAIARTASNQLLLPFSAVKGKLREALCECGQSEWVKNWMGPRETDEKSPERGRLRITDFIGRQLDTFVPTETRVAIAAAVSYTHLTLPTKA